jgi:hypothetical protein
MISPVDLSANNPLRPAAWRYQAAVERVATGKAFPRLLWDTETHEVATYLRRAGREADPRRLAAEFRALHTAFGIYQHADPGLRYALEARLLTGTEASFVATSLGTDAAVVESYHAAFFDVSDRLTSVGYIMHRVVNPSADEPYQFRDRGWKLLAYVGGAGALSRLISPDRVSGFDGAMQTNRTATKFALADRMRWLFERGSELDPRLLGDWPTIVGLITGEEELSEYARIVHEMVMNTPMQILDKAEIKNIPELQTRFELRAHQVELLANGFPIPDLEELEKFEWPSPNRDRPHPAAAAAE